MACGAHYPTDALLEMGTQICGPKLCRIILPAFETVWFHLQQCTREYFL